MLLSQPAGFHPRERHATGPVLVHMVSLPIAHSTVLEQAFFFLYSIRVIASTMLRGFLPHVPPEVTTWQCKTASCLQ